MNFMSSQANGYGPRINGFRVINPVSSIPMTSQNIRSSSFNRMQFQRYLIRMPNGEIIVQ